MYTCVHVDLDLDLLCSFFRSQIFANAFFTYDGQTRFDNSQSISISRASQRNRRPSRSTIAPVMYVVRTPTCRLDSIDSSAARSRSFINSPLHFCSATCRLFL